ncbi:MAG: permease-like cell division protein FtsX [Oscillospiraceae bacterium]|jgi:cell division transport system permease protein|nr:permease-like cell division protein FtsX [Oscillospiraceae bacterium]
MRLNNFGYLFKEGARNIVYNKLMSFACIGVLMACLLLIGGAAMLSLNVSAVFDYVEAQNEVFVDLEADVEGPDLEIVELGISSMENIARYLFISREEALAEQISEMGEDGAVLSGLLGENNPLPDRFIVQVANLEYMEDTAARLRELGGVEKVTAPSDVASILVGVRHIITVAGAGLVLILVIVSVVIITNTIKLTIVSRRREISIMKYVGATDAFIRMPFLVEGVIIGLLAAILAFLLLGFGYTFLLDWISENLGAAIGGALGGALGGAFEKAVDFWGIAHYIFGGFAALGVLVGMMGSGIFVRRYMKV